ncbi:hypothetical protein K438DRAFT_2067014 [Mycena galopus ATCC 62051]|nr:hypothetical protein K438DRAFT_2067014 [Mycena galopus ATCC 62051]
MIPVPDLTRSPLFFLALVVAGSEQELGALDVSEPPVRVGWAVVDVANPEVTAPRSVVRNLWGKTLRYLTVGRALDILKRDARLPVPEEQTKQSKKAVARGHTSWSTSRRGCCAATKMETDAAKMTESANIIEEKEIKGHTVLRKEKDNVWESAGVRESLLVRIAFPCNADGAVANAGGACSPGPGKLRAGATRCALGCAAVSRGPVEHSKAIVMWGYIMFVCITVAVRGESLPSSPSALVLRRPYLRVRNVLPVLASAEARATRLNILVSALHAGLAITYKGFKPGFPITFGRLDLCHFDYGGAGRLRRAIHCLGLQEGMHLRTHIILPFLCGISEKFTAQLPENERKFKKMGGGVKTCLVALRVALAPTKGIDEKHTGLEDVLGNNRARTRPLQAPRLPHPRAIKGSIVAHLAFHEWQFGYADLGG